MARVHQVAKRRVGKRGEYPLSCRDCGQPIEYGQPYKWTKVKRAYGGVKLSYHPGCTIRQTHTSTSALAVIWEAQAALDFSGCESPADCQAVLDDFAGTVREVEAEYREKVENMEAGFGHRTYQADELEERAEALEAWADELEGWESSGEVPDEPEEDEPDDGSQEWDTYRDDLRDSAQQLADECPV